MNEQNLKPVENSMKNSTTNKKLPGKPFQKGQSGNAGGRPKIPDDIKKAIQIGRENMARVLIKIEGLTIGDAKKIDAESMTLVERLILKAFTSGDHHAVKIYQDRVYGRAKESIEIEGNLNSPVTIFVEGVDPENTDTEKTPSDN